MVTELIRYSVELVCGYPEWWRFNLYIMVVGFDRDGNSLSFTNFTDRIYDLDTAPGRTAPPGFDAAARKACVESPPCHYIEVYAYAVTNTFPESESIKDSPPFQATLMVSAGGRPFASDSYEVNQWGGLTISGRRYGPAGS
ncbi:MAG: hypothetical protein LUD76_10340 [Alistipes sp.]|nr:hypothetical protein [Alistipes sp.]